MTDIQEFINDELGLSVKAIQNQDGSISMNVEDVAYGLGMIKVDKKGDKTYTRPNISGVNGHLESFGILNSEFKKEDFMPESLFYLVAMKASNETARTFQFWLATQVIPSIRKHGAFIADSENVDENYVLNELRFSQKRTIKTFSNADVLEVKKIYNEFKNYIDSEYKYRTDIRVARYKSVEKGLQQLHDNLALIPDNVGDCYNIKKLKEQVILDRTTLEKRISGGEKAAKTKRIAELEDAIEELQTDINSEVE